MTQDELKTFVSYDAETGAFHWIKGRGVKLRAGAPAGCIDAKGYRVIRIRGKMYKAHRLANLYMGGTLDCESIDHINLDKSDNRWGNLRVASRSENQSNRGLYENNCIGIKGVSVSVNGGETYLRGRVQVGRRKVTKWFYVPKLGIMEATKQAAIWAVNARDALHGEFARHG